MKQSVEGRFASAKFFIFIVFFLLICASFAAYGYTNEPYPTSETITFPYNNTLTFHPDNGTVPEFGGEVQFHYLRFTLEQEMKLTFTRPSGSEGNNVKFFRCREDNWPLFLLDPMDFIIGGRGNTANPISGIFSSGSYVIGIWDNGYLSDNNTPLISQISITAETLPQITIPYSESVMFVSHQVQSEYPLPPTFPLAEDLRFTLTEETTLIFSGDSDVYLQLNRVAPISEYGIVFGYGPLTATLPAGGYKLSMGMREGVALSPVGRHIRIHEPDADDPTATFGFPDNHIFTTTPAAITVMFNEGIYSGGTKITGASELPADLIAMTKDGVSYPIPSAHISYNETAREITINGLDEGEYTVDVAAAKVQDVAGNENEANSASFKVEVPPEPVAVITIADITAAPTGLESGGGSVTITITGTNLDLAEIKVHDGTDLQPTTDNTPTSAKYSTTLPSNSSTTAEKEYTFTAYVNGASVGKSVTVAVAKSVYTDSITPSRNGSRGGGSSGDDSSPSYADATPPYKPITLKGKDGKTLLTFDGASGSITNGVIKLIATKESDSYIFAFSLEQLKELAEGNVYGRFEIHANGLVYNMPFDIVQMITGLSEYLKEADYEDYSLELTMDKLTGTDLAEAQAAYKTAFPDGETVSDFYEISFTLYRNGIKQEFDVNQFTTALSFTMNTTGKGNSILVYTPSTGKFAFVPAKLGDNGAAATTKHHSVYVASKNNVVFDDVKPGEWYSSLVTSAANKGLVEGVGGDLYMPDKEVTRAQFIQMIANAMQLPQAKANTKPYYDVKKESWHYDAIMKANSAGLLDKFTDGAFKPNQPITREEMAVILAATVRYENISVTANFVDLSTVFSDYPDLDPNNLPDIELVYKLKIMRGTGGGMFEPQGVTTRAQAAAVQINLLKSLKMID